jgi:hypothetical protein
MLIHLSMVIVQGNDFFFVLNVKQSNELPIFISILNNNMYVHRFLSTFIYSIVLNIRFMMLYISNYFFVRHKNIKYVYKFYKCNVYHVL